MRLLNSIKNNIVFQILMAIYNLVSILFKLFARKYKTRIKPVAGERNPGRRGTWQGRRARGCASNRSCRACDAKWSASHVQRPKAVRPQWNWDRLPSSPEKQQGSLLIKKIPLRIAEINEVSKWSKKPTIHLKQRCPTVQKYAPQMWWQESHCRHTCQNLIKWIFLWKNDVCNA